MSLLRVLRKAFGVEGATPPEAGPLPGAIMSKQAAGAVMQDGVLITDAYGNPVTLLALTAMSQREFMQHFALLAARTPCAKDWLRDEFYRRETQKVNTSMRRATLVVSWLTAAIFVLTIVNVVVVVFHH